MAQKPEKKYCDYLETLRRTGVTNMLGAGKYLVDEFGISEQEAKQILTDWTTTYEGSK